MKRFFLAAFLAIALHGLLFWISPALFEKKILPKAPQRTVTLNLIARKAPSGPKASAPVTTPTHKAAPAITPAPKRTEPKTPPPKVEEIPVPEKVKPQNVEEEVTSVSKKTIPIPVNKVSPPPKKIEKPKKISDRRKKPIKTQPHPKPLTTVPAKKSVEIPPRVPEKGETPTSPLRNVVPSDKETGPAPNGASRTAVTNPSPSSSAPDGQETQRTKPSYKSNPPPEYPRTAKRRGYGGTVVLKVLVSEKGTVLQVKLSKSSGHLILDRAAEESVRTWTFEPGTIDARKVEMWVNVPVRFDLKPH